MSGNAQQSAEVETARLVRTLAGITGGASVQLRPGQICYDAAAQSFYVMSGGTRVTAIWNQGIVPYDGANCVLLLATESGSSIYFVAFITDAGPTPGPAGTVTAFTAGTSTCTVQVGAATYTAQRVASYTPAVGDTALLTFAGGNIYATCALSVYTPPPVAIVTTAAPPAVKITGTSNIPCQDSATWTDGYNWNSYFGQNTYSGSGYVPRSTAAWFYNGGTNGLADKTNIGAIRFYLAARRNSGAYNSTATVHFYAHNAQSRGAGEPARVAGPYDLNVAAGWGGGWVTLPQSFAAALQAGGGVSLAGDPYVGFTGVGENGNAGALSIDWSK
jgi:hypothetical protein